MTEEPSFVATERPPEAVLWDFLRGALMTRAVAIVAELGVADALAHGPRDVADIAEQVGADPATLHRILRALASDGVFAEDEPAVFRNTTPSELLRSGGWPEFAHLFGGVFYRALVDLDDALVSVHETTFSRMFGTDFWSWLAAHPAERAAFDAAMAGGKERKIERLSELDWSDGDVVIDVGGGNGALLAGLLARRPELRGIVFDLPETDRDESTFGDRLQFVAGSFFESVPVGDAYVLSGILHDWDDERAGEILRVIRKSARPHARVLVMDSVIEPGNAPQSAKWLDLLMLVFSGRERTEADWDALFESTGFRVEQIEDGLIEAQCF